ncbi:MAG TPA: hypothetical protein VFX37_14990, partial [Pseudolabrys sp.]|nr:hypothetical protein [Pseudolabrys sp.]
SRRYIYTPELLAEGRRRYEQTEDRVVDIAADFRCHGTTFQRLANRLGWVRHKAPPRDLPPAAKLEAEAEALAARYAAASSPPSEGARSPAETGGGQSNPSAGAQEPPSLTLPFAERGGQWATQPATNLPPIQETVARLHADILNELASVEAMRKRLDTMPQSPIDAERTARTLANLMATLRQIAPLSPAPAQDKDHDENDDFPTDIDELRNELARRINAFVASRTGEGNAGGSSGESAAEP